MAAKKKTPAEASALDAEFLDRLHDAEEKLVAACMCLDELRLHAVFKQNQRARGQAMQWVLQGFTDDLVLNAQSIVRDALTIRSNVQAGLPSDQVSLLKAVGGEF
jgi:hypothetical protein